MGRFHCIQIAKILYITSCPLPIAPFWNPLIVTVAFFTANQITMLMCCKRLANNIYNTSKVGAWTKANQKPFRLCSSDLVTYHCCAPPSWTASILWVNHRGGEVWFALQNCYHIEAYIQTQIIIRHSRTQEAMIIMEREWERVRWKELASKTYALPIMCLSKPMMCTKNGYPNCEW